MRMLWDYENLYISAVLEEPDVKALVKDHDDIVYHDNDFEVFLNPFCDEKLYYELETNALGTVMDLLMEKPYRKGGTYIMPWDFKGLQLAVKVHGTLNKETIPGPTRSGERISPAWSGSPNPKRTGYGPLPA